MPRPHPPEFRRRAVGLLTRRQACRGASPGSGHQRELPAQLDVAKADIDEGRRDDTTGAERAKLVELRRELRVSAMENAILRRSRGLLRPPAGTPPKITYTFIA